MELPRLPGGNLGMADRVGDGTPLILLQRGLPQDNRLHIFLHECAHIKLGHLFDKPMTVRQADWLDESEPTIAQVVKADAEAHVKKPREQTAEGLALIWLKEITDATWPGSWNPELKLRTWLKG